MRDKIVGSAAGYWRTQVGARGNVLVASVNPSTDAHTAQRSSITSCESVWQSCVGRRNQKVSESILNPYCEVRRESFRASLNTLPYTRPKARESIALTTWSIHSRDHLDS